MYHHHLRANNSNCSVTDLFEMTYKQRPAGRRVFDKLISVVCNKAELVSRTHTAGREMHQWNTILESPGASLQQATCHHVKYYRMCSYFVAFSSFIQIAGDISKQIGPVLKRYILWYLIWMISITRWSVNDGILLSLLSSSLKLLL